MQFREYKYIKNVDGTYTILDVPVFELGKHRGEDYDDKWAKEALVNFQALKEKGWLPRVIIGHSNEKEEKPAIGFWDNLQLKGKTFHTDMTRLAEKTFNEIRERKWPGRSVEVNARKKKFTALALLGGSEPYFQFEPLEVKFQSDPDGIWIDFSESNSEDIVQKLYSKIVELFKSNNSNGEDKMAEIDVKQLTADITAQVTANLQKDFDEKFDSKYNERFKQDTGYESPVKFKESRAAEITAKFQEKKKSALEKMTAKGLAPALINEYIDPIIEAFAGDELETIKFCEGEKSGTIIELMEKFAESLVKRAENNTITVDYSERARFGEGDEDNPNFKESEMNVISTDREKLHKKILAFQEKHKIESYEEAADRFMESA